MDEAGSQRRRITAGVGTDEWPVWSPDGRRIAYEHRADDGKYTTGNLYLTDPHAHHHRALTHNVDRGYATPLGWSPNSRRLLFESNGLWVMNVDTGHRHRLTPRPGDRPNGYVEDDSASWSPTKNEVTFLRYREYKQPGPNRWTDTVYVISAAGTGLTRLSPGGVHAYDPSWSADGNAVAFVGTPADTRGLCADRGLYVANSDGTNVHRVLTIPHWILSPIWSPDGKHLAYIGPRADRSCSKDTSLGDLYVVDSRGGEPTIVTTHDRPDALGELFAWQRK